MRAGIIGPAMMLRTAHPLERASQLIDVCVFGHHHTRYSAHGHTLGLSVTRDSSQ
jgi:hypothetical protein